MLGTRETPMKKKLTEQEAAAKRYQEAKAALRQAQLEAEDAWLSLARTTDDEMPERPGEAS
jgi:hypothetical protein